MIDLKLRLCESRYRCSNYKTMTILAAAAISLLATTARANIVDFLIDQSASSFTQRNFVFGPAIGNYLLEAQAPGSDTAPFYGHVYVDFQPGSIQLLSSSQIRAVVTGDYSPFDPVVSNPLGPPGQGTTPGNYGLKHATLGIEAVQYNMQIDFGYTFGGIVSTPMALAGGTFDLDGQAMQFVDGRQAYVSGLANDTSSIIGALFGIFGSNGADVGTWDGATLTIPMHSTYTITLSNDFGGVEETIEFEGQIVARPVVPEPSSVALVVSSIVSLAICGWRRKRYFTTSRALQRE